MKDEGMQMINSFVSRGQTIVSKMERKQPNNFNFIKRHGSYQMRHWFVYEKRDAKDCVRSESRDVCYLQYFLRLHSNVGIRMAARLREWLGAEFTGNSREKWKWGRRRWLYILFAAA